MTIRLKIRLQAAFVDQVYFYFRGLKSDISAYDSSYHNKFYWWVINQGEIICVKSQVPIYKVQLSILSYLLFVL